MLISGQSIALVTHRIDDVTDLPFRHAVRSFPIGPGCHGSLVGATTAPVVKTAITIAVHPIAARVSSGSRFTEVGAGPGAEEVLAAVCRTSSVMTFIVAEISGDVAEIDSCVAVPGTPDPLT